MTIRLILTGGTIDKCYRETSGELVFSKTHLPEMLVQGRNSTEIEITELMLKDSLDMVEADRKRVLEACQTVPELTILITHGTDTLVETARELAQSNLAKTIVLTGAMIPFEFKQSDALFNVGFALAAVQTLPVGVYIAMNGKVFDWDKVRKDCAAGRFIPD